MDDGRYARLLADTLIHQGEPDETFRGQQQAVLTRCIALTDTFDGMDIEAAVVECFRTQQLELADEIEQEPTRWRELTGEGPDTARGRRCRRAFLPSGPGGATRYASDPAGFPRAVAAELVAKERRFDEADATCIAEAVVTGLGADALGAADPTAAEIDLLVVGGYRADELGLTIDGPTAASRADGVLVCVGNRISLVLTLVPGNVLDALGRTDDPPDLTELTACAVDALDPGARPRLPRRPVRRRAGRVRDAGGRPAHRRLVRSGR